MTDEKICPIKVIKLLNAGYSIVDSEDYENVSKYKWYNNGTGYAFATDPENHKKKVYMHRLINKTPVGVDTDHINHNRLDNRKSNLRNATPKQNQSNMVAINNSNGVKGVWRDPLGGWNARMRIAGVKRSLGRFKTKEAAAEKYLAFERARRYGSFYCIKGCCCD